MVNKFCSYLIFVCKGKDKAQISFLEISHALGVSERTAKRYIKKDLENGFIRKESTQYKCRKYKTLLSGRNIYYLEKAGQAQIKSSQQESLSPQSFRKKKYSSKEEFAKGKPKGHFFKFKEEKKRLLEKYKLFHLVGRAPDWWFKNLSVLEKTLKLLSQKKKRGYKVKNEERWISSVIRGQGRGFRHKVAKKTSLVLAGNRKESWKLVSQASNRVLSDFDRLGELKKRGLDTSFKEMEKLLRKGFSHLSSCAEVLLKVLKWQTIKNLNAFLNWLVSLKEPFEIFKKRALSVSEMIDWAKSLFKAEKKNCVFDVQGNFDRWLKNPLSLDSRKVFVQFHIFRDQERSCVRILNWVSGQWEDRRLTITHPFFRDELVTVFRFRNGSILESS